MEKRLEALQNSLLFRGMKIGEVQSMLECLGSVVRRVQRGETILSVGDPADRMGVVFIGGVQVCREDSDGRRTILTELGPGELFAEAYACAQVETLPVSVRAVADSEVILLDCGRVLTVCPSACPFHTRLIRNLTAALADKNVFLARRVEHLSKRTLRDKLLSYLEEQAVLAGSRSFCISLDRQGLADYLCADRSALSRELGRLRQEGILLCERNQFQLLER